MSATPTTAQYLGHNDQKAALHERLHPQNVCGILLARLYEDSHAARKRIRTSIAHGDGAAAHEVEVQQGLATVEGASMVNNDEVQAEGAH